MECGDVTPLFCFFVFLVCLFFIFLLRLSACGKEKNKRKNKSGVKPPHSIKDHINGRSSPAKNTDPVIQIKSSGLASCRACCHALAAEGHRTRTSRLSAGTSAASCSGGAQRRLFPKRVR